MGKVARNRKGTAKRSAKPREAKVVVVRARKQLTAKELANYRILRRHLARRLEQAERMTPAERAQADAEWELFAKTVDDERARVGARLLYRG